MNAAPKRGRGGPARKSAGAKGPSKPKGRSGDSRATPARAKGRSGPASARSVRSDQSRPRGGRRGQGTGQRGTTPIRPDAERAQSRKTLVGPVPIMADAIGRNPLPQDRIA